MNRIETRLRLSGTDKNLRSISEQNGIHCVGKPTLTEETIPPFDFRLFRIALEQDGGVDRQDAKITVKNLRKDYETGNASRRQNIADVMGHAFEGFIFTKPLMREPIPVNQNHQETIIYTRGR